MKCSLDSLEAFVQAAALKSFSAAGRRLGKRQSTISEAVQRLEIDLGVELFDRSQRYPCLTPDGEALLGHAEAILDAHDRMQHLATRLGQGMEPKLTLVLSDSFQGGQYEQVLGDLDRTYPELEFECLIAEHGDVLDLVGEGRATLGIVSAQPHYPPEFGHAPVPRTADFALYVAPQHPLARQADLKLEQLTAHRALSISVVGNVEAPLNPLPLPITRNWSAPDYLMLLEMAVNGFGWVELPCDLADIYAGDKLVRLEIKGWPRSVRVDVVWSRRHQLGLAGQWLLQRLLS